MAVYKKSKTVDTIGMITSSLCAIHCAALPILFSFGLLGGASSAAHDSFELAVVVFSLGLGAWSIYQAMTSHKRIFPQLTILLGIAIIVTSYIISSADSHGIMAIGGFILVAGHWINRRFLAHQWS